MNELLALVQYVVSPAIVLGIFAFPAKKYVEHLISRSATIQEQKYSKELALISDERKHRFEKDLKSYTFFVEKKFEVYTNLYEMTQMALGAISGLKGVRSYPDFEKYSEEDLKEYLDKYEFYKSDRTEFLGSFVKDKRETASRLQKEMYRRDFVRTSNLIFEAKNFFILKQLYISDKLEEQFAKFFQLLVSNYIDWELFLQRNHSIDLEKLRSEEKDREQSMREIKQIMKLELRNTYLGNIEI